MTPEQAFELISKLVGFKVGMIRDLGSGTVEIVAENGDKLFWDCLSIDWGDKTRYSPPKYRPVTKEDVIRALEKNTSVMAFQRNKETGASRLVELLGWFDNTPGRILVWVCVDNGIGPVDNILPAKQIVILEE